VKPGKLGDHPSWKCAGAISSCRKLFVETLDDSSATLRNYPHRRVPYQFSRKMIQSLFLLNLFAVMESHCSRSKKTLTFPHIIENEPWDALKIDGRMRRVGP